MAGFTLATLCHRNSLEYDRVLCGLGFVNKATCYVGLLASFVRPKRRFKTRRCSDRQCANPALEVGRGPQQNHLSSKVSGPSSYHPHGRR